MFIPPIFLILRNKLSKIYLSKSHTIISTINEIEKKSEKLVILGNGPSLKDSIEKYRDEVIQNDCIAVNSFCTTEYYDVIKPNSYLFADPAFFCNPENESDRLKQQIVSTIDALVNKTKWSLNLIIPSSAINSYFVSRLSVNTNIRCFYYNEKNLKNSFDNNSKFQLWDKNFIAPPAQNVLNCAVYMGIFKRYKEIYLLGADTSFIELLHVDQSDNRVYTIDSHFYGTKKVYLYWDVAETRPEKLHENLDTISLCLKYYWELEEYAKYAGVKVYNASEYSLIDAFERKKLN